MQGAINSKDNKNFTKKNFITLCGKFVNTAEATRLFDALVNKERYIRKIDNSNYIYDVEAKVMSREKLIQLFDFYHIRKSHGRKYTPEQRAKQSEFMKNHWHNVKEPVQVVTLDQFTDEQLEAELNTRKAKREHTAKLNSILEFANMSAQDLIAFLNEKF